MQAVDCVRCGKPLGKRDDHEKRVHADPAKCLKANVGRMVTKPLLTEFDYVSAYTQSPKEGR